MNDWFRESQVGFQKPEGAGGEGGEPKKPMTEAERRQSLFPGKKVEKWDVPLPDKTVQQQVGASEVSEDDGMTAG